MEKLKANIDKAMLEADKTYEFYMIVTDDFTVNGVCSARRGNRISFGSAVDPNFTLLGNESEKNVRMS
jgi:hypothetical protein